jgi:hypothetical protein
MFYMIKMMAMLFLAVVFPWLVLLLKDNPGGAIVALVLQASIIGWPFASTWAWKTGRPTPPKNKKS